jgi:hypothetical protein
MATATVFNRHRWQYPPGVSACESRSKTCSRCGIVARTFGMGAGRVWSYRTAHGQPTRAGLCVPKEGK